MNDEKEVEIARVMWGDYFAEQFVEDEVKMSALDYSEDQWEEEIALDPELKNRLAKARKIQKEIRNV